MENVIEFVKGMIVKAPRENAPDFVKAAISIKREELAEWLSGHNEEWINIDVKESKGGKWYASVSTFKPREAAPVTKHSAAKANGFVDDDVDGLPF